MTLDALENKNLSSWIIQLVIFLITNIQTWPNLDFVRFCSREAVLIKEPFNTIS